jgi:signal peptidase I
LFPDKGILLKMQWIKKLIIAVIMTIVIFLDLFHVILMFPPKLIYTLSESMADFARNMEGKL